MKITIELSDEQEKAVGIENEKSNRNGKPTSNEDYAASLASQMLDNLVAGQQSEEKLALRRQLEEKMQNLSAEKLTAALEAVKD